MKENCILVSMLTSLNYKMCYYFQDSYISERANTMQNIESTIVELGQIFTQLAHMVKEQEESVQR